MPVPVLRPYQVDAIAKLRNAIRQGAKRIVLIAPTGAGKTIMAAEMIRAAVTRGSRSLVIAHRKELIDQTFDKLQQFGVMAGIIMAQDRRRDDWLPVQVASVQTLARRLDRKPPAQLIIVDECHHATSDTYKKIVDAYPDAIVIGLTATPWRSDKIGLSDIYETSILSCTPAELIAIGALVNYDAFAYDDPELHNVKITAGEFNQHDLGVACNTKILVGHVVKEYVAHASGKRAIVFPVNIAHSQNLVEQFRVAGFSASHIDCDTKKSVREAAMTDFRNGRLMILSSVGVLSEGFDAPAAEVCILARPTKSLSLHLQMIGRVLRPCPEIGKQRALIHCHSGNILRHGFADDPRDYSLTATPQQVIAAHTCPACFAIFNRTRQGHCPNCNELIAVPEDRPDRGISAGHDKIEVEGKRISRKEIERIRGRRAELGLTRPLSDQQLARAAVATREQKAAEFLRLKKVAAQKGFKDGFVSHQFRGSFSHWPKFTDEELARVEPATQPFFPLEKNRA